MKKKLTLYIEADVVDKAKEIGLNLSKICENALIRAINALEQAEGRTNSYSNPNSNNGAGDGIRTHATLTGHKLSRPEPPPTGFAPYR